MVGGGGGPNDGRDLAGAEVVMDVEVMVVVAMMVVV